MGEKMNKEKIIGRVELQKQAVDVSTPGPFEAITDDTDADRLTRKQLVRLCILRCFRGSNDLEQQMASATLIQIYCTELIVNGTQDQRRQAVVALSGLVYPGAGDSQRPPAAADDGMILSKNNKPVVR